MLAARPFDNDQALHECARRVWWALELGDWLEAFAAHPRIGDLEAVRARYGRSAEWSAGEQSGAASADEETLQELMRSNADYERRFGHRFIVCATGKSASEMLEILRQRLGNPPDQELRAAAKEQLAITELRLDKLG